MHDQHHAPVSPVEKLGRCLRNYLCDKGDVSLGECKKLINGKLGPKLVSCGTAAGAAGIATRLCRLVERLPAGTGEAARLHELRATADDAAQALKARVGVAKSASSMCVALIPIGFSIIVGLGLSDGLADDAWFGSMGVGFVLVVTGTVGKIGMDLHTDRLRRRAMAWDLVKDAADAGLEHIRHRMDTAKLPSSWDAIQASVTRAGERRSLATACSAGLLAAVVSTAVSRRIRKRTLPRPM